MTFRRFLQKAFPIIKNKYVVTGTLFLIIIIFLSQNNLLDRLDNIKKLNQLRKDNDYYNEAIMEAERKMDDLLNNPQSLEKFAREEYLMKNPDEDIFLIVREED